MAIKTHIAGRRTRRRRSAAALAVFCLLLAGNTWAIPSPDLVINLSASVAQLLGLLSVVFGGFAISKGKRSKRRTGRASTGSKFGMLIAGALLLVSVVANLLQYTASVDAKNARLQTNLVRKSVENGETVGDTSLKTLSFSDQQDHPRGIGTETLAEWLDNDEPLTIIDVREDEEFEVGAIEGAVHLRYPDVLAKSSLIPAEGNVLFLCYSGNRSSELCTEFSAQGRECNFMVGGYEKWLSESRPMQSEDPVSLDELRKVPDYTNKDVLLDTPDVHALVQNEGAEFVDVRYPGDFVKNHLPGAHNITMRALTSATLRERIDALPDDKPLIGACYDKRSCFYSQLIGLRLDRAGKDFRGRYTVPHEYFVGSSGDRAHVAAWKVAQSQQTLAGYVVTPLSAILNRLVEASGHFAIGLLALVLLIRLSLFPLALKAERDNRVQKSLGAQIAALKKELRDHPRAYSEATVRLFRKYRVRPVVNVLSSVFQLTFTLVFFSAVNRAAPGWEHTFGWITEPGLADPLLILPALASVLFAGVLASQIGLGSLRKNLLLVLAGAALLWLLQGLSAAANLYLAISMGFLLAQNALFVALDRKRGWSEAGLDKTGLIEDTGLVPLSQAHYLPESTGKKAARLGKLIEEGYNVPDGFVFTSVITNRSRGNQGARTLLDKHQAKRLNALWASLKCEQVAVRSSGANEDGEDSSFAGVYESVLNVTRDELISAVRDVYESLSSDRSDAYNRHTNGHEATLDEGGVVVQKMVPAKYAGVMFTEHPATTGAMMIEVVSGLGEDLVSGNVTPDTYAFGKVTGQLIADPLQEQAATPLDFAPLLAMGRELETLFGHPQDIEWAYANGRFYLLQARDITRSAANGSSLRALAETERRKLIESVSEDIRTTARAPLARRLRQRLRALLGRADAMADKENTGIAEQVVFQQSELSELLPRPTPLSADLMGRLWSAGGSTDLACEDLGIPYQVTYRSVPYITTIFGWTYVNRLEEKRRLGKGPGALASFRLARNAEAMEQAFREEFLPQFQAEMLERNAIDMQRLSLTAATSLLETWVNRFVEDTYYQAELVNIAADYHMKTALTKLAASGLEPTLYLNDHEETVVSEAMALLQADKVSPANIEKFLMLFGHRAPLDYELSTPRFAEDPQLVRQYITRSAGSAGTASDTAAEAALPSSKVLAISIRRARAFQRLKEEAKHYCLIELAQIRQLLLAIDRHCDLDGRIFQLTLQEAVRLHESSERATLQAVADQRHAASQTWQGVQLPTSLSLSDLERLDMVTGRRPDAVEQTELAGKRVAGDEEVTGTARVITDANEIDTFVEGEILVARMTDPTWYPLFSQARGIITEVGGWLSHAAIVAREYDLPAIVGVTGACQQVKTGDVVTLTMDGSVVRMDNRRESGSPMRSESAESAFNDESQTVPFDAEIYHLTAERLSRYRRNSDRRAQRVGDRRKAPRYLASGELQPDRRAVNRAALKAIQHAAREARQSQAPAEWKKAG